MADPERDDLALGEEAVRRGLLTQEHLAEARETQRLAVDAGLPISLAEVLLQRQYLNAVQIETLQQRLREPAQAPAPLAPSAPPSAPAPSSVPPPSPPPSPPPVPRPEPLAGAHRPPRTGDSTRALPQRPVTRGSTTGPKLPIKAPSTARLQGPFPPIPSTSPPPPAISPPARRSSGRMAAVRPGSSKRGSGQAPAVPSGTGKRGSSRSAAVPSPTAEPASSIAAGAISTAPPATTAGENIQEKKPAPPTPSAAPVASPVAAPNGGGVSSGSPSGATAPVASTAAEPSPSKAGTAAVPPARPRSASVRSPAKPAERTSRAFLWVGLVLLLLVGSNTITWLVARRTAPVAHPKPKPRSISFGPSFDPLAYWLVIGPFPAKSGADLSTVHEPEDPERDVTATLKGTKGPLKWKLAKMEKSSISFTPSLGTHTNCNAYGLTYVECASETKAVLGIGSDDSARVWLNGEKVHENPAQRGCVVDQDRVKVTLKAGANEILIKIGQGSSEWGFAVTVRSPDGKPLPGLKGCLPKEIAIPEPPKPVKKPAPVSKPPVKPAKPATPPTKPAVTPTKPVTTPTKPATPPTATPAKPVTPPTQPAATPAKPVAPPTAPVTPPDKPAAPTATPAEKPSAPADATQPAPAVKK